MLDNEDLKWIATTTTELNSTLQQISRYTDLTRRHKGEDHYAELLGERVEMAAKTAQALFDRVTSKILARTSSRPATATPKFTVVPPPSKESSVGNQAQKSASAPASPNAKAAAPSRNARAKPSTKSFSGGPVEIPEGVKVKNANGKRDYLLLIEDEPEVADIASDMLADEGYKVILAADGFEALKIYQQMGRHIGLVILDFFLPVMDGDAVFDELRALNPNVNVVLSSGFAEQSKISAMLASGLRGFIPKPYTRQKLLDQVRSTLESERMAAR